MNIAADKIKAITPKKGDVYIFECDEALPRARAEQIISDLESLLSPAKVIVNDNGLRLKQSPVVNIYIDGKVIREEDVHDLINFLNEE